MVYSSGENIITKTIQNCEFKTTQESTNNLIISDGFFNGSTNKKAQIILFHFSDSLIFLRLSGIN
jgi:hypothetical protein